ncbi:DUF2225 domain-containing protein [Cohnella thailandensis]|uniref:DUF2225 domain-containing protein n=1 Tax=Cohnella thailandensis TaxID=557557 RepID=A0A841SNP1_9BACL|nr:DUF2225 domain-containing protein [Cohnella thailandensis]MBB6632802.1 DUF2225 domain-containing protein [Cohnella thailandensis]MBP1975506.1 uncharacterized protein (DUF2225 family) [Cohnella thailandensis]
MDPLYASKITCSCCEATFQTSRVRPSFKKALRTDTDFCCYFGEVNPDYYVVRICPYCGFASTENFKPKLLEREKRAYLDKIGTHWVRRDYGGQRTAEVALETYKLALLTAQTVKESDRIIAGLLHHIAWLYRYDGNKAMEDKFLGFALEAYVDVYKSETISYNNARLLYLIGELYRRLGNYNEAVRWFSRVIHDKRITDSSMIRASREQWMVIREDMTRSGQELPEEMKLSGA